MECSPYRLAASLLANLQANLADTRGGAASRVAVYPHTDPAIEFGCDMAWVGVGAVTPSQPAKGGCGVLVWDIALTMGVARCYPVAADNGAPDAAAVDSAARDVLDDGEAMRRALVSAFVDQGITHSVKSWQTRPPMGGAHASTMALSVQMQWGSYVEPGSPMQPRDPRA